MTARRERLRRLARTRAAVERELVRRGGLRGPIRPGQRAWSWWLDRLEELRQKAAER